MFEVKPQDGYVAQKEQMEDGSPGPVVLVDVFRLTPGGPAGGFAGRSGTPQEAPSDGRRL